MDFIIGEYGARFCFEVKTSRQKKATPPRKRLSIACSLLFEPQNEYETVALFCLLAEELGFLIKRIRSDFPDGLLEQNGTDVPVEFVLLSSNYREHCHPATFDGTVICWRKDEDLGGIKILSLEEYLRRREKA